MKLDELPNQYAMLFRLKAMGDPFRALVDDCPNLQPRRMSTASFCILRQASWLSELSDATRSTDCGNHRRPEEVLQTSFSRMAAVFTYFTDSFLR